MIRERAKLRSAGNDILQATQPDFDKWGPFVGILGRNIATVQAVPAHFNIMRLTPGQLAQSYKRLATLNWLLETGGLVGGASAASAGAADVIKKGSIVEGAKKTVGRLAGKGPISEVLVDKYGPGSGTRAVGLALVAAAVAKLVHESGKRQMAEIRALAQHEFQRGNASEKNFTDVFGDSIDPSSIRKYWEYR